MLTLGVCECHYKECLKKNFGKESAYYNEVDNSQKVVENNVVKQYDKRFGRIVKGNKKWNICRARVIGKDKDLSRVRPIVSYRNWYGRSMGKRVARALNVLITCVVYGHDDANCKGRGKKGKSYLNNVLELVNTSDAVNFVTGINKFKNWELLLAQNKFTSIELDIKEQFTNLDRKECIKAFKVRFPEIISGWDKDLFINIMYSQMLNLLRKSTNEGILWFDGMCYILEWLSKGYDKKWIARALLKCRCRWTNSWLAMLDSE